MNHYLEDFDMFLPHSELTPEVRCRMNRHHRQARGLKQKPKSERKPYKFNPWTVTPWTVFFDLIRASTLGLIVAQKNEELRKENKRLEEAMLRLESSQAHRGAE